MPASVREGSPTPTDALHNSGKRETRVYKEPRYLRHRCRQIGHLRLNKIRPFHLATVLTELAKDGYSGRSVNLYLITVRGVLKAARRYGHLKPPLPFEGLDWQKVDTQSRRLCTAEEVDQLCEVALQGSKNGRQFVDYLRFLQYSGTRFREAMSVRWQDVAVDRGHVTIGAEGESRNRTPRTVDLNPQLEAHLRAMATRRQPDSVWLFPSPQRGAWMSPGRRPNAAALSKPRRRRDGRVACSRWFLAATPDPRPWDSPCVGCYSSERSIKQSQFCQTNPSWRGPDERFQAWFGRQHRRRPGGNHASDLWHPGSVGKGVGKGFLRTTPEAMEGTRRSWRASWESSIRGRFAMSLIAAAGASRSSGTTRITVSHARTTQKNVGRTRGWLAVGLCCHSSRSRSSFARPRRRPWHGCRAARDWPASQRTSSRRRRSRNGRTLTRSTSTAAAVTATSPQPGNASGAISHCGQPALVRAGRWGAFYV